VFIVELLRAGRHAPVGTIGSGMPSDNVTDKQPAHPIQNICAHIAAQSAVGGRRGGIRPTARR
jgi:hypothetical protein